ncbi:cytochrome P450 [Periconia macrospinosa]|uniref:Cytochrome P450 n=1 Tax=Periconia macrospinosa TaxID=97972 RepID=A0A2V1D880_9PLEO|nr:cytochrome P450 [Periconia macrospinosa]
MASSSLTEGISYPNLVGLSVALGFSYVLCTAIYRLYFHPLAKFPGPFWARISTFPSWWHTRFGDRHLWLYSLQEKYGPEFRYRPDGVLINTPSAFKKVFGPTGNVKKSDYYKGWPRHVNAINTWSATNVDQHARKRRVMNYAFSEAAMRSAEVFLHSNIDRWLELLGQVPKGQDGDWSESLNMCDWMNWLVFDILGDLCFGKCFDMKESNSDLRHIPEMMVTFLELLHPICYSPWNWLWVWAKPRGLDRLIEIASPPAVTNWGNFVATCLASRTKDQEETERLEKPEGEARKDFFYWLFKAVDPETGEKGYDLHELFGECEMLTIAGSDTTSVVLTAAFFYLARNPAIQEKLARELRSTFSSLDEIKTGTTIMSCKYLTAFIQEAMRMTPPVSAEPSRVALPGGTTVGGHYIPEGNLVSVGMYCLNYNKDHFPEPFKFRPERWIAVDREDYNEGSSPDSVALAESSFFPFSFGARGCVGKNLAWIEMRLVLAKAVYMFQFRQDPTNNLGGGEKNGRPGRQNPDQYQLWDMFVANRKGPIVQLKKRE